MMRAWPGSLVAVQDIFTFFDTPFHYEYGCEITTFSGIVGNRKVKCSVVISDPNSFVIEVESPTDEHALHGVILQHCIKIDCAERENGKKSVRIYTFGGEIDLDDRWGIHAILR